jgi:glycosyltransferase involved in cell wall biosynthesis
LFVVGQLALGGLEKQVYLQATGLDRRRFEVSVVSLTTGGRWSKALEKAGVRVFHLRRRGRWDWRRLLALYRLFRWARPHLVYSISYEANAYARIAGLLASVPVLVSSDVGIYLLLDRWQEIQERLLVRFTDCVICNAEAVRRNMVEAIGLPEGKVLTIRNGVVVPAPAGAAERERARTILGATNHDCVVGTIARLDPVKNLSLMVEAAALCLTSGRPFRFLVVGGGPAEASLRQAIRDRHLEGSFVLLGERESASDLLPGFDIFVLTSRSEGLPNAVMEAMAAGVPCVCTDVGGCRELVDPGVTGYLVPAADSRSLADRILELAENPQTRERMGRAGRLRIENEFSVGKLVSMTDQILTRLLAAKDSSPRGRRLAMSQATTAE